MGDVVSLVEKAEEAVNADEAAELTKRMMTGGGAAHHAAVALGEALPMLILTEAVLRPILQPSLTSTTS